MDYYFPNMENTATYIPTALSQHECRNLYYENYSRLSQINKN